uniref:Ribosomal protein L30 ferredoxin-like fold domain-containing protein n=1 Tax=Zooxanthella nutricula TaxID=1333877 RepID=A0A7S2J9N6_9DINO
MDEGENTAKAVLRPRRPGESIKVAETVLKRRDRNLKAAADRAAQVAKARDAKNDYKKGKLRIIRAERFIKQCRVRHNDVRRLKVSRKKNPTPKPLRKCRSIAVARNGRTGGSKETKQTLKKLGLSTRHKLIFLPNTEETANQLLTVKPFCYWGRCSFKTLFNIVHKKAAFKDPEAPKEKTMLSDNVLIEKHLGDLGVLCTEDLAHVLHTQGKHFKEVAQRLWPINTGDIRMANGMVKDQKFTFGDLQDAMDLKLAKLFGE